MQYYFYPIILLFLLTSCTAKTAQEYKNGRFFLENEKYDQAIRQFSIAIHKDSSFTAAYAYRGIAQLKSEEYQEAIKDLNKALELDRNLAYVQLHRAIAKTNLKNYSAAIVDLDDLIDHFQAHTDTNTIANVASAYNNRGLIKYLQLGDTLGALSDYTKAIELEVSPKPYRSYLNRGRLFLAQKNLPRAINDIDTSIVLNPDSQLSFFTKGQIQFAMQDFDGAVSSYSKALEINPKYWAALNARGLTLLKKEQYQAAIKDFTRTINHDGHAYAYNNRGYAKYKLGNLPEALSDCEKSLKLDPNNSWVYFNLGLIKYDLGETDNACKYFEQAHKLGKTAALTELATKCS